MAVDYAKVRVQFGRPIGSFQAIKHKCADMLLTGFRERRATPRPDDGSREPSSRPEPVGT